MEFDPRILGGVIGGAVFVLVITGAAVVRRARARRRDRIVGRVRLVGEERRRDRLARTAERLAAGPTAPVPPLLCDPAEMLAPAAGRCTCGAKPEGVERGGNLVQRYHRLTCPEWTKEGAEAFAKVWKTRIGRYDAGVTGGPALRGGKISFADPTTGRRESVAFEEGDTAEEIAARLSEAIQAPVNPALSEDAAERFARTAEIVDPPLVVLAADPPPTADPFQGQGGDFGGGGATASYDPPPAPAPDPAPTCDHSPSYDTSSSCDSGGGYSGGGDL